MRIILVNKNEARSSKLKKFCLFGISVNYLSKTLKNADACLNITNEIKTILFSIVLVATVKYLTYYHDCLLSKMCVQTINYNILAPSSNFLN
jgi:hypothetical protein